MRAPTLAGRVLVIEAAPTEMPHAFGRAIALAYYAEPRATIDIDLNVFVPVEQFSDVADPLVKIGASAGDPTIEALIRRDGQAGVMWDRTPIDLFFSYDAFHEAAGAARHVVPFADGTIPILAADHLIVSKAACNRPQHRVDIESMLAAVAALDAAEVLRWVARITRDEDPRFDPDRRAPHTPLTTQVDTEPGPGGPVQAGTGLRGAFGRAAGRTPYWFKVDPATGKRKQFSEIDGRITVSISATIKGGTYVVEEVRAKPKRGGEPITTEHCSARSLSARSFDGRRRW